MFIKTEKQDVNQEGKAVCAAGSMVTSQEVKQEATETQHPEYSDDRNPKRKQEHIETGRDEKDDSKKHVKRDNTEQDPSKTLFVGNLAFQISKNELKEAFVGCDCSRIPYYKCRHTRGFGFVEFKTVEDAEIAKRNKDGTEINGRVVYLEFAKDDSDVDTAAQSNGDGGKSKLLFVRNLGYQVSEDELKETFAGCVCCRIPSVPCGCGYSRGFGFVEFKTVEDAEIAKRDKDGIEIDGRAIQLEFANDKPGHLLVMGV